MTFTFDRYGTYKNQTSVFFLQTMVLGGELYTVLRHNHSFDETNSKFYAACVVLAFEHIHSKDIIYRDLKPENLLIDANGYLMITDFGFAKKRNVYVLTYSYFFFFFFFLLSVCRVVLLCLSLEKKKKHLYQCSPFVFTTTLCGTPQYLAPELVHGWVQGFAVDWWTLGILLYEMVVGNPPFEDDEHVKMYEKIIAHNPIFPKTCSAEFRDLIEKLLEKNGYRRLGASQGAHEIKKHSFFKVISHIICDIIKHSKFLVFFLLFLLRINICVSKKYDWTKMEARSLHAPFIPTITSDTDLSNFEKVTPPPEDDEPIDNPSLLDWADEF
ncbi:hypothetical protein RFI_13007 [Reticulomyxa filosa]|uniref:non-specific serine/threonine protein kinase n=1 Tax=Reticulomyxa filosa TaxID=46433 RepID=X6NFN2_RETFI|nr:hypothetical protein RFI_13007 [Reticulomyxa filosa]|eukprot:ETO24152.1 hypothetical protein RFI_13007 [Reticulomyxa filosa]